MTAVKSAASEQVAGNAGSGEVCGSNMVATSSSLHSNVQCWNCDGDMTLNHQCGVLPSVSPEPESVVEEHIPPLPLCHYCCHLGSGDNPVHYYQQCLCGEKACTCQCYCTEEQLLHRKQFFPDGFSGPMVPVDPLDRQNAKSIAEKRIGQWPIWPCESEDCARPP